MFVDKIRQNRKQGMEIKDAVNNSADYCIENNFLKDFLQKHSGEALDMILSLYDEELHNRTIREEGRKEGLSQGRNQIILSMLKNGISPESAAIIANTTVADIIVLQNEHK